jgi:hypothetical protein
MKHKYANFDLDRKDDGEIQEVAVNIRANATVERRFVGYSDAETEVNALSAVGVMCISVWPRQQLRRKKESDGKVFIHALMYNQHNTHTHSPSQLALHGQAEPEHPGINIMGGVETELRRRRMGSLVRVSVTAVFATTRDPLTRPSSVNQMLAGTSFCP